MMGILLFSRPDLKIQLAADGLPVKHKVWNSRTVGI